jgi:M6 family metalloprotease-like protein
MSGLEMTGSGARRGWRALLPVLAWLALCLPLALPAQARGKVALSEARFEGLTKIVARSSVPLDDIGAHEVRIRRSDGGVVEAGDILDVAAVDRVLTITLRARVFALVGSQDATLSTRAFGRHAGSAPVRIARSGEPASNGHLAGTSGWTDEGWDTVVSDPAFVDSATGQHGMYRFSDTTPNRDAAGRPVVWRDGALRTPAHRAKTMLVLFIDFPDRRAADATPAYREFDPYLKLLQPVVNWFDTASYGQFQLSFAAPQDSRQLAWLTMSKNAKDYKWSGAMEQTGDMFEYCHEAVQLAYDRYGIRAGDYDLLLLMPAQGKSGLHNGPANINDQYMGQAQVPPRTVLVERDGTAHTIDTFVTAGNDLFYWGYRWLIHETGHTFGLPDLYMYQPQVKDIEVDRFFHVGGWDIMGDIHGQSNDFLAWHKWKLRWIRDDQVDVVSRRTAQAGVHVLSPVETPGGSKMVVVRTGVSTAYVAEFRTALGVNGLQTPAGGSGVLIYRLDTGPEENTERPLLQVISRQYYSSPEVGGASNLNGIWRPVDKKMDGMGRDATWQPGDVFSDPATGVTIAIDRIGQAASGGSYTEDDVAVLRVSKQEDAPLARPMKLDAPVLSHLTQLRFGLDLGAPAAKENWFVRQRSRIGAANLRLRRANGNPIPASRVRSVEQKDGQVLVTLQAATFRNAADAAGLRLAIVPYFNLAGTPDSPVRIAR